MSVSTATEKTGCTHFAEFEGSSNLLNEQMANNSRAIDNH